MPNGKVDDTVTGASDQTVLDDGAGQQKDDDKGWREQNTRLRQELAEQKELNRKAVPFVQVALTLQKQDEAAYQKILKGEPLTPKQEANVAKVAAAQGLTVEDLEKKLDEKLTWLDQKQTADRQAATAMEKLNVWATEKLPGYDKMQGTPTWNGVLSSVLGCVENGTYQVPPDVEDPYKWAVEQTYNIIKGQNPELAKGEKRVGKSETDRAAEILAAGRKPSSSKPSEGELDGLPDDVRKEIEFTRSIGGSTGKKFSP